ncbi:MAG: metallophosphoesterase family protein [Thermoplasmata archaeon]
MPRHVGPAAVLRLEPDEADDLLDQLEKEVPACPALIDIPARPGEELLAFGDTHGDWRSTELVVEKFLEPGVPRILVGLGDYVDRAPRDCGEGSVANALFLLGLAAEFPGRVFLLQGNHETTREIPVVPIDLPEEVDSLWGPDPERYARLTGLLGRGPLAALSPNGAYFAHGGFPRSLPGPEWRARFDHVDEELLIELVWADCRASATDRGLTPQFDERDLDQFFERTGARFFLRGHDPHLAGRAVYHDRCLTLHTSRIYERYGGVLVARFPLDRPIRSALDLTLEHLASEGQEYPEP